MSIHRWYSYILTDTYKLTLGTRKYSDSDYYEIVQRYSYN